MEATLTIAWTRVLLSQKGGGGSIKIKPLFPLKERGGVGSSTCMPASTIKDDACVHWNGKLMNKLWLAPLGFPFCSSTTRCCLCGHMLYVWLVEFHAACTAFKPEPRILGGIQLAVPSICCRYLPVNHCVFLHLHDQKMHRVPFLGLLLVKGSAILHLIRSQSELNSFPSGVWQSQCNSR